MQTYCSDFLGRSFKISCAIHVLLFALMGTTFSEVNKSEKIVDEYIFIDVEQNEQISKEPFMEKPLDQMMQINQAVSNSIMQEQRNSVSQEVVSSSHHKASNLVSSNAHRTGNSGYGEQVSSNSDTGGGQGVLEGRSASVPTVAEENSSSGYHTVNVAQLASEFASLVEAKKEYPYIALKRGETGRVGVYVRLNADGSLDTVEVMQSSGIKSLDAGAVKAVKKACPFIHGAKQVIEFVIPIYYELNGG